LSKSLHFLPFIIRSFFKAICQLLLKVDCISSEEALVLRRLSFWFCRAIINCILCRSRREG
jgi:hypothetical protein